MFELRFKQAAASTIGFTLLRAKKRKKHVARLDEQRKRLAALAIKRPAWRMTAGYLDASLHGSVGRVRWLGPQRRSLIAAEYAADAPDYVRACVDACDKTVPMSVRLVAIAGTSVMKDISKRRYYAADLRAVMRDFGMVRASENCGARARARRKAHCERRAAPVDRIARGLRAADCGRRRTPRKHEG